MGNFELWLSKKSQFQLSQIWVNQSKVLVELKKFGEMGKELTIRKS
jgi:hypothetical protein